MFADAIETVGGYTRAIKMITRQYKDQAIVPGLATLFFVNDDGCAVTCKHVAQQLIQARAINENYAKFKAECARVPEGKNKAAEIKKLELVHKLKTGAPIQEKVSFEGCIAGLKGFDINMHPDLDLALIRFKGFDRTLYKGHAVFVGSMASVRPGDMLCRLGFPFPEFSDFRYNEEKDDIEWDRSAGSPNTPRFPIEGMFTRHLAGKDGSIYGIELSTPGLRGQSGGPLFTKDGLVCGMQSATRHLHLGFDMVGEKMVLRGKEHTINNQPFLHVGHCINAEKIKEFLRQQGVEFFEV